MKVKELRSKFKGTADLIIMDVLGISKTELVLGDIDADEKHIEEIEQKINRLKNGEPLQYILGKTEFMSLEFITEPDVLIPRADTEILVEAVMKRLNHNKKLLVADLCCGSGCIGISLAHYMKNISVKMVDISERALTIAQKNAVLNGVDDRLQFKNIDIMKQMPDIYTDCIVSNPPYIKSETIKTLDRKVRQFEPEIALDGGDDGLNFYRHITKHARLKEGGLLAFEIGYDQGCAVAEILNKYSYTNIEILCDIENRSRVVLGYFTKVPAR